MVLVKTRSVNVCQWHSFSTVICLQVHELGNSKRRNEDKKLRLTYCNINASANLWLHNYDKCINEKPGMVAFIFSYTYDLPIRAKMPVQTAIMTLINIMARLANDKLVNSALVCLLTGFYDAIIHSNGS